MLHSLVIYQQGMLQHQLSFPTAVQRIATGMRIIGPQRVADPAELDAPTIQRYRAKLRYKVWHHLGSFCPDVEDIVQETLSRFLRARRDGKIRNPDGTAAFLSGVCNNVILEYRRRLWKEPLANPEPDGVPEREAVVAPEVEAIERQDAIDAALAQLSDRDRQLLRAFYLDERSKAEICSSLGWSDVQFRVALFRAKNRFRTVYCQRLKHAARLGH